MKEYLVIHNSFKVEFPPLAAYRLEFGEKEPDPEEVRSCLIIFVL